MAWTALRTWTAGEVVTSTMLNTDHRDNLLAIDALLNIAGGSYTDGGFLLGSGAAAITPMARPTAGQLPVGQVTGDPIHRDVFTGGGVNPLVRHENGGIEADISAITTGGLLRGTGPGAMGILPAGSDTQILNMAAGLPAWTSSGVRATQAAMEAETDEATFASPNRVKYSPGVAKGWCRISNAGALETGSYNVTSVTDTGVGDRTIVWNVDFNGAFSYACVASQAEDQTAISQQAYYSAFAVGIVRLTIRNEVFALSDGASSTAAFGDQ